jgi:hypothetical protein
MRRMIAASAVLLVLTACGDTQRPEGIVERWLQSLDQGRAGTPERYAPDDVSDQILPGFRDLDPGRFDVIEVGPAISRPAPGIADVSFRVEDTDGNQIRGTASVEEGPSGMQVMAVDTDRSAGLLPSEGGPRIAEMTLGSWLAGGLAALALTALALLLMTFVRRSTGTNVERRV